MLAPNFSFFSLQLVFVIFVKSQIKYLSVVNARKKNYGVNFNTSFYDKMIMSIYK